MTRKNSVPGIVVVASRGEYECRRFIGRCVVRLSLKSSVVVHSPFSLSICCFLPNPRPRAPSIRHGHPMAVANDEPDWLLDEMDKVAKPAKKAKKAAPGGGGGGCGGCCTGRLCCAVTGLLLLLLAAGTLAASLGAGHVPEFASWSDKLCLHSDMWVDSKGRERVLKHYPSLDNLLFHAAEAAAYRYRDTLGPGLLQLQTDLLVLVATHHKTGTVLARKLFNSMCLRLRQCWHRARDGGHRGGRAPLRRRAGRAPRLPLPGR